MTCKQFFKSTSFKCIAALLAILLVCGIFLTVAYGFLEVSAEERLQRAIDKIYTGGGATVRVDEDIYSDASSTSYGQATITAAHIVDFKSDDGDQLHILVQSRGAGGYAGGSVTVWVAAVIENQTVSSLYSILIASNSGQTLMSSINSSSILTDLIDGYEPNTDYIVEDGYVVTGATFTSSAIVNAVNGAIRFVNVEYLGMAYENPYENFDYTNYINTDRTTHTVENGVVTYDIFTLANGFAQPFNITVVVGADGTVTEYTVVTNGSTGNYGSKMYDTSNYVGKNSEYFTSKISGDTLTDEIKTGATLSNFLCIYAGAFATSNYDKCVEAA